VGKAVQRRRIGASRFDWQYTMDGFQKLVQRWRKYNEVLGDFVENNYAALKIIDVGIFLFYFIKIFFPFHFLFKWRQNLSAHPSICIGN
jgi:hypothetical protein